MFSPVLGLSSKEDEEKLSPHESSSRASTKNIQRGSTVPATREVRNVMHPVLAPSLSERFNLCKDSSFAVTRTHLLASAQDPYHSGRHIMLQRSEHHRAARKALRHHCCPYCQPMLAASCRSKQESPLRHGPSLLHRYFVPTPSSPSPLWLR